MIVYYIYAKIIINICIKPSQIQQSMEEKDERELLPFAKRDEGVGLTTVTCIMQ